MVKMSRLDSLWHDCNVAVTGGASFIGSHLVDQLIQLGAKVTVIDNLSSGTMENLSNSKGKIKFLKHDLEYSTKAELNTIFHDQEYVFHLAAVHGGRGYITTHPADVCSNLAIDHHVFQACTDQNVKKVVFASTACVYPTDLQKEIGTDYKLKEADTDPTNLDKYMSADIEYGWGKLMSEIQLLSFYKQYGLKSSSLRFVTAYGPRENETHAIIAWIYKAFEKMDPFQIWGDGKQERDFTYVQDIVDGCILAAQSNDISPINLGTGSRYTVTDVVEKICEIMHWKPSKIQFDISKPSGALSRALDNSRAKKILNWTPKISLGEGLRKTIEWYLNTHKPTGKINESILLEHQKLLKVK
jgi:UDP-glucose 4-epimerase